MKTMLALILLLACVPQTMARATANFDSPQDEVAKKQETKNAGPAHPLSEAQRAAIKAILADVKTKVGPPLMQLAQSVKEIHANMLAEKPDETVKQALTKKIADALGELIAIRIQSNQKIVNLLTPEQKEIVKSELAKREAPTDLFEIIGKVFDIAEK
jgi:Spy/CpxP family protein refolding chaperone